MKGITNFINLVIENWTTISVILVVIGGAGLKIVKLYKNWKKMTDDEKIDAMLDIIQEWILKMMCDAEIEWSEFKSAGGIKKSGVIEKIYTKFPQLAKFTDQEKIIEQISNFIEDNMEEMNKIMNEINNVSVHKNEENEEEEIE
ncbi:MAG: hypothetical protein K2L48_02260 [Mycoplasmoidaceae bacterium]|nr:hypothetical protein [Mycoplasmoidaceae bacterium]